MKLPFVAIAFLLASCSLDYGSKNKVDPAQIPLTKMSDFQQVSIQNGREVSKITGQRAEYFDTLKETRLKDFSFESYDDRGAVVEKGRVEAATIKSETNDATIQGKMEAWSSKHNFTLETSDVTWNNKEKTLATQPGSQVFLHKEDGSKVRGSGLNVNFRTNELILKGPLDGQWALSNKGTDESEASAQPTPSPVADQPARR